MIHQIIVRVCRARHCLSTPSQNTLTLVSDGMTLSLSPVLSETKRITPFDRTPLPATGTELLRLDFRRNFCSDRSLLFVFESGILSFTVSDFKRVDMVGELPDEIWS